MTPRAGRTVFAGFVALTVMGIALVLTLFVRLGQEVFVYVQRTFGFVFLLATYHVFTTHGAKDLSPALKWYMAALATAGIAAFAYRSLFHNVLVRRKRYTVAAANRLDDFVTEIVLEPRAKPLAYRPGQFVFVELPLARRSAQRAVDISLQRQVFSIRAGEIGNQFHPFSITSAPDERTLRITVKAIGDYTSALRRLDEGAEAIVEGPFGSFSNVGLAQPRQIWAAGGIGVTPFLSMARSLGDGAGPPVHFYYCVERPEEAHFLDEFRALAGAARRLRDHGRLARPRRLPERRPPRGRERRPRLVGRADLRPAGDDRQPPRAARRARAAGAPDPRGGVRLREARPRGGAAGRARRAA